MAYDLVTCRRNYGLRRGNQDAVSIGAKSLSHSTAVLGNSAISHFMHTVSRTANPLDKGWVVYVHYVITSVYIPHVDVFVS